VLGADHTGLQTYLLAPRDPADIDLLVEARRPAPSRKPPAHPCLRMAEAARNRFGEHCRCQEENEEDARTAGHQSAPPRGKGWSIIEPL